MIRKVVPDRTMRFQAPEPLQPGQGPDLGGQKGTIAAFRKRRTKTIDYAAKTKDARLLSFRD